MHKKLTPLYRDTRLHSLPEALRNMICLHTLLKCNYIFNSSALFADPSRFISEINLWE